MTRFFKNTAWRGLGLALIAAALAHSVALAGYNPADPTVNNAVDAPVTNPLGRIGANVADVTLQTLGLAAWLLALPVLLWGVKLLRLRWLPLFWLNLAFLPVGVILLALALSVIPPAHEFVSPAGYGGALGQQLYQLSIMFLGDVVVPAPVLIAAFVALGLPAYAFSLALTGAEWAAIGRAIGDAVRFVLAHMALAVQWLAYGLMTVVDRMREGRGDAADADTGEADASSPAASKAAPARPKKKRTPPRPPQPSAKRVETARQPKRGEREMKDAQATLDFGDTGDFRLPQLQLLTPPPPPHELDVMSADALESNARMLESVLADFSVQGEITNVRAGPVVTLYELEPAPGIKAARVIGLADDIARSMSAVSARVARVPGKKSIGIELPNPKRQTVYLRELLAARDFEKNRGRLPIVLGKEIGGDPVVADLASMPHLLVAGTTGSGKSVGVNAMILSLLYRHTPETLRLIMVDPKMLELSIYDNIPHLLTPVVTDPKKAVVALKWLVREMEDRYRNMSQLGVRSLSAFNKRVQEAKDAGEVLTRDVQTGYDRETGQPVVEAQEFDFEPLPFIVVVIDEMADLMLVAGKDVEATVQRLAQMARAAGIHVIMATQRPSVDVITGTIKANFPTRMSYQVTSKIDSRTILGEMGAEQLLGMGDMLFMPSAARLQRVHGAFVSDEEVEEVVAHLRKQGAPDYITSVTEEPEEGFDSPFIPGGSGGDDSEKTLYDKAVDVVLRDRRPTTSYIQRRLKIGYNKAASLIEEMEEQGVISAPNHKGQREVLVPEREDDL
ncbi:FtsK/SpoIIIE family DNA translocase [Yunchengibacter salinarum]|uniref:FtsK/SpoIIIE family DNA translocase n=1 Tax=Yunchengibacter salinarum TaxID=3133399 RepID=UPI0035B6256E